MTDTHHWRELAACKQRPDVNFFPHAGELPTEAKAVCAVCPVVAPCLKDALKDPIHQDHGIRGGKTVRERQRMRGLKNR